ncbi:uncharacterized protein LOC129794260 [Lutzomyia longipalpis]|uniref:Uncharacterized protein n=1 Tax=Lutzomyia longipalpis TaxID=7200 RepID=A0A1B0CGB9_LUTLO|nr:uncharacterized protein LOC129794260 [Lutzomyia longipalpis]
MPLLRKCCCCFSLKTGGVILGWIGAVSSFLVAVICLIAICNVETIISAIKEHVKEENIQEDTLRSVLQIFLGVYIALSLIGLISASLLIAGSVRRNRYFILPWLITCGMNLLFGLLFSLFQVVGAMTADVGYGFFTLFIVAIVYGFELYLWLAIFSLFQQLREEETKGVGAAALIYKAPPTDGLPAYTGFA